MKLLDSMYKWQIQYSAKCCVMQSGRIIITVRTTSSDNKSDFLNKVINLVLLLIINLILIYSTIR